MASQEDAYRQHQKAFRCAFDYLNSHYPPEEDPEWWAQAAKDGQEACAGMRDDPLAVQLTSGVLLYLEKVMEERRGKHDDH